MKPTPTNLNSVEKALKILLAFKAQQPNWGVRELALHLGFSPATVQRILQTLKTHAFVDQDPQTRQYRLGNIYFNFFHILQCTYSITRAAVPFMGHLLSSTKETVHLNVLEGLMRICIDNIESPQNLKASMPIGNSSPLYAGASSKCLLAFSPPDFIENYLNADDLVPLTDSTITNVHRLRAELAEIGRCGYAASLGERTPGLGSLSAPVFDHRGTLLASISLAIPEIRFKDSAHRKFCLKELLHTARDFSHRMGYRGTLPYE